MKSIKMSIAQATQLINSSSKTVVTGFGIQIHADHYTIDDKETFEGQDRLDFLNDFAEAFEDEDLNENGEVEVNVIETETEILIYGYID